MRLIPLLVLAMAPAAWADAKPAAPSSNWSAESEGLRARLVATATTDDQNRPEIELAIEIENVSDIDGGIGVPWGDPNTMFSFAIEDEHGKALTHSGIGGSYASGPPYVVLLPVQSTLHYRVTPGAIEYVPGGTTMFRPLTFQAWDLPAKHGPLFLKATLSPAKVDAKALPRRAMTKPIELPKIQLP
jgi:hypothetical protein